MEGKTSEQTNGPGALVLPLAWRHNFWQFYRIVVLVLPRIGSDRVGLSLPTPHFWVLAFVEHKTHLNSIRMWHFCIFFLFSWLCCCCCVRWHFGTLINVAKLFGGGGQSHWTLKSNSDSTFSSVFFLFFLILDVVFLSGNVVVVCSLLASIVIQNGCIICTDFFISDTRPCVLCWPFLGGTRSEDAQDVIHVCGCCHCNCRLYWWRVFYFIVHSCCKHYQRVSGPEVQEHMAKAAVQIALPRFVIVSVWLLAIFINTLNKIHGFRAYCLPYLILPFPSC